MSIGKVCNDKTITLSQKASITEAAKLMEEKNIGCVVVIDDRANKKQAVGILTDRDIVVNALAKEKDINSLTVKDVMSKDLLLIKNNEGIKNVLDLMCKKGVRRAPIVNENNDLCGIVSVDDLMFMLADEFKTASTLIHNQITNSA